jgi:hypothetical protein
VELSIYWSAISELHGGQSRASKIGVALGRGGVLECDSPQIEHMKRERKPKRPKEPERFGRAGLGGWQSDKCL